MKAQEVAYWDWMEEGERWVSCWSSAPHHSCVLDGHMLGVRRSIMESVMKEMQSHFKYSAGGKTQAITHTGSDLLCSGFPRPVHCSEEVNIGEAQRGEQANNKLTHSPVTLLFRLQTRKSKCVSLFVCLFMCL